MTSPLLFCRIVIGATSVADPVQDGSGTPDAGEERTELSVNVLVAAVDQELDILDDVQDSAAEFQRLRCHPRTVAVVDAVVPPLKDGRVMSLKMHVRPLAGIRPARCVQSQVGRPGNAEDPL